MANKKHKFQTNFASGVISENAFGRVDTAIYANGLKKGTNIIIENPGGATRRPGTLFVFEFQEDYVRLLPFSFNTQQTYLISFSDLKIDIFYEDALVASVVTDYLKDEIPAIDFAQSADSMVLTHGDHTVNILRRLGTHADWELVPAPLLEQPQELICSDGLKPSFDGTCTDASEPTLQNVWGTLNGYPKYCTFFQGRLYLAATHLLPQSVWGSVIHDFFNFDIGTGLDNEAIADILDTDFINPIVAIYAEKKLYVFSTGDEFVNNALVITPAASAWQRASKYGSFGTVRPVAFDGGVIYLDRSGRTIRQMIFQDSIKAFDSDAVSMFSEHLIKAPIAMGVMKGRLFQASNFLYMVNSTGSIAVLNLSRAAGMAAWTQWTTQGSYKDIITFNNEITYVLVERRGKWILEKLADAVYVDSGAVQTTERNVPEILKTFEVGRTPGDEKAVIRNNPAEILGDRENFFGIDFNKEGKGRVVIVVDSVEVYKSEHFIKDPTEANTLFGRIIQPINKFAQDDELADTYYEDVPQTEFYLYSMLITDIINADQNYIDGLPHLIGREVVMNLDGSAFHNQTVIPGDELPGGGQIKTYPDGAEWLVDTTAGNETYITKYLNENLVATLVEGYYKGTFYAPLTEDAFWNAYPIVSDPFINDEYLEQGAFYDEVTTTGVIIDYDSVSGDGASSVTPGANAGEWFFTPPPGVTGARVCISGAGGSGAAQDDNSSTIFIGGGSRGNIFSEAMTFLYGVSDLPIKIGEGGAGVTLYSAGVQGGSTSFNGEVLPGGIGGEYSTTTMNLKYEGNEGIFVSPCGDEYKDGKQIFAGTWGGEAGAFGDGGFSQSNHISGGNGGIGAGGGSIAHSSGATSGRGGNGRVTITWNLSIRRYKTRRMVLETATLPTTDGVVEVPRAFTIGQAGLWFGVDMETLPLYNASVTNEPKRIVSIMPRFVNTAGLNIANNLVPSRRFGHEVLDEAPPKKSGIQKIRLLGYSRETTIRITQYDPLPMTLVSIDIELKY